MNLNALCAALEARGLKHVKTVDRATWKASLREGGNPTVLPQPLPPYLGSTRNPNFDSVVASGYGYATTPGFHTIRHDPRDFPNTINLDSHDVIEDLASEPYWPELLAEAGLEDSDELRAEVRAHVFAHHVYREDHHSPAVPADIASAQPKPVDGSSGGTE